MGIRTFVSSLSGALETKAGGCRIACVMAAQQIAIFGNESKKVRESGANNARECLIICIFMAMRLSGKQTKNDFIRQFSSTTWLFLSRWMFFEQHSASPLEPPLLARR